MSITIEEAAVRLRDRVAEQLSTIHWKRPHAVGTYYDAERNPIGYSATVWAVREDAPIRAVRIDLFLDGRCFIATSMSAMIRQGAHVCAIVQTETGHLIHDNRRVPTLTA